MNGTRMYDAIDPQTVRGNWGWFLAFGIGLVLLGLIALGSTVATTIASAYLLGTLLLISGVMQCALAFRAGGCWLVGSVIVLGLLFIAAGWSLMTRPIVGLLSITALMAMYFVVVGLVRIISAIIQRTQGLGWAVASGVLSLLLGILLWSNWPLSGLYAIGLFIGIDLVMSGIAWIVGALAVRNAPMTSSTTATA